MQSWGRERRQPTPDLTIKFVNGLVEFFTMCGADAPGRRRVRPQGAAERVDGILIVSCPEEKFPPDVRHPWLAILARCVVIIPA